MSNPNYWQPNPYGTRYQPQPYQPYQPFAQQQGLMQAPPITNIAFTTADEAKGYILMPNTSALLIDRQNSLAWFKTANNVGESFCQFFKFEEVNADGSPIKPPQPTPQIDFNAFIKKEDLPQLGFSTKEDYQTLYEKIEALQKQIFGGTVNE